MFGRDDKESAREYLRDLGIPMDSSSYWWVKYPIRAFNELQKMHDNTNAVINFRDGQMGFYEFIQNNFGTEYCIRIAVQDNHPFAMPKVYIVEPEISTSMHMYGDGHLCLMHPDDHSGNMSILDIRNLAATWCFCFEVYKNTGDWPAAEYNH